MPNEKIFISYRRSEGLPDEVEARWLRGQLAAAFGEDAVFRDVDDAVKMVARPFMDVLREQLHECTACVIVIGPKWIADIERLHNEDDPVRVEIATAISRKDVRIAPITVGGVSFPDKQRLPSDVQDLLSYGGLSLTNDNAENEVRPLVAALRSSDNSASRFLSKRARWLLFGAAAAVAGLALIFLLDDEPSCEPTINTIFGGDC